MKEFNKQLFSSLIAAVIGGLLVAYVDANYIKNEPNTDHYLLCRARQSGEFSV